jgi:hypothetical protein
LGEQQERQTANKRVRKLNGMEISDKVSELMKEADRVKYVDFQSRNKVLEKFSELRVLLIMASS